MPAPRQRPSRIPLRRRAAATGMALVTALSLYAPVAVAQDSDSVTILRDTEIEEILHRDADPVFIASGLDPKTVKIILLGTKEINATTSSGPTPAQP